MPIAIDSGSPAVVSAGGVTTVTTASFTRPAAGGLLVAMVMCTSDSNPVVSGGSLTWTRRKQQVNAGAYAEIWTAPVTGSGAMTVTVTITGTFKAVGVKVDGVTGQHSSPAGNSGGGTSAANTLNVTGYTSSGINSRGFFAAVEENGLGNPTSTDTGFGWTANATFEDVSGIAVRKAANTPTIGETVTFNADAPGTSAAAWTWAALEILGGAVDASVEATTITAVTAVPAPAVGVSASPRPATITAVSAVPAPTLSAGSSATPATVPITVAVPAPAVTTADTELVAPTTIAVAAAVPAPGVSANSSATPATVQALTAVPAPGVRVDAEVMLTTIAITATVPAIAATVPVLPGDRVERAGQIEWNGFLLGSGTPYSWQELTGWASTPPIISGNVDQPLGHGSYPGQPYAGERAINWGTLIKAPRTQIGQVIHDLRMVTGVPQSEDELPLVIWDFDDGEPYLVYAHLAQREPGPLNKQSRLGIMRGALQWICSDPRLYSVIRHSASVPIDTETDLLNDGNDASPQIMRIPGPAVTPQVENLTLDRVIAFDLEIADGEVLEVDVKHGNVSIGTTDLLDTLIEGSVSIKDFVLGPGANRLLFTAESGGTVMDVLWRHAST